MPGEPILISIITLVGVLCSSIMSVVISSKLTNYRLLSLEKKLDKVETIVAKIALLEERTTHLREDVDVLVKDVKYLKEK